MVKPVIDGVTASELRQIPDERGAVLHMLRSDAWDFVRRMVFLRGAAFGGQGVEASPHADAEPRSAGGPYPFGDL